MLTANQPLCLVLMKPEVMGQRQETWLETWFSCFSPKRFQLLKAHRDCLQGLQVLLFLQKVIEKSAADALHGPLSHIACIWSYYKHNWSASEL